MGSPQLEGVLLSARPLETKVLTAHVFMPPLIRASTAAPVGEVTLADSSAMGVGTSDATRNEYGKRCDGPRSITFRALRVLKIKGRRRIAG
jgi:hypothetical protein